MARRAGQFGTDAVTVPRRAHLVHLFVVSDVPIPSWDGIGRAAPLMAIAAAIDPQVITLDRRLDARIGRVISSRSMAGLTSNTGLAERTQGIRFNAVPGALLASPRSVALEARVGVSRVLAFVVSHPELLRRPQFLFKTSGVQVELGGVSFGVNQAVGLDKPGFPAIPPDHVDEVIPGGSRRRARDALNVRRVGGRCTFYPIEFVGVPRGEIAGDEVGMKGIVTGNTSIRPDILLSRCGAAGSNAQANGDDE